MLHQCWNRLIERFKTAYERFQEAVAADPTVDPVTTMDCGSLPAQLVAGRNTGTKNVITTTDISGVVVDTVYSSNIWDIVLHL